MQGTVHPDTNQPLPWTMRITSFLPANIPINMGFILSAPTLRNVMFWQVFNQTFNAQFNYGNANASSPQTSQDIMKSYFMATGTAVTVALCFRQLLANISATSTGAKLIMLNAITATAASALAGSANNWIMRSKERETGIDVIDPATGESCGKSQACATWAVKQTAISRIFMALPISLPAFALIGIEKAGLMPTNKYAQLAVQIGLICGQLLLAVPLAMAAFPQFSSIKATDLEP